MKNKIDKILEYLLVALLLLMVLNITWQVISRFLIAKPSSFTEEAARFLMIWLGCLGGSYTAGKKLHPSIDLLKHKVGEKTQKGLSTFIELVIFSFGALILLGGGSYLVYTTLSLNQLSAALQIPIGYVYLCLPLSGIILMYYSMYNLMIKSK